MHRLHLLYAKTIWESPRDATASAAGTPAGFHEVATLLCLRIRVTALSYRPDGKMRPMSRSPARKGSLRPRMLLIATALMIGLAGRAGATGVPQIIRARQGHFKTLGRAAKSLRDQIWRSLPNWNVVTNDTHQIERLAAALPSWFPSGSGKGHGVRTRARAAIWSQPRLFARAAQRFLNRAKGVDQAAASRNLRALRVRIRGLGQTCASCHRRFRAHSSWW
jgi:cytochrome c556